MAGLVAGPGFVAGRGIRKTGVTEKQLEDIARILGIPEAQMKQALGSQGEVEVQITRSGPPGSAGAAPPGTAPGGGSPGGGGGGGPSRY